MATIFTQLTRVGGLTLALALSAGTAMAQFKIPKFERPVLTSALTRDLAAVYEPPGPIAEHWTTQNPCPLHSHTYTAYVKLRRVLPNTPLPSGTKATLFKDGEEVAKWDAVTQPGPNSEPIVLGSFTWTMPHPCPDGTSSVTPPPPSYGYRLVIDPVNQISEAVEFNNTVEFRINQAAVFAKVP